MKIEPIFPSALGVSINDNHNSMKEKPLQYCLDKLNDIEKGGDNWSSKVYNTCGTKNLITISEFGNLNDWVFQEVVNYVTELGFKNIKLQPHDSWFNVYKKYDYQEYHDHGESDISAVYFLESNEQDANLVFKSNEPSGYSHEFVKDNPYTWKRFFVPPVPGRLVVFKSHMQHSVEQHLKDNIRISLAYNFKIIK
jgi:uncharacterized protein (TIGR02466 family)|tara:strand:- start:1038 stop:1622 length:585 start_codon:yes stop_codon:yes gene_type:complete